MISSFWNLCRACPSLPVEKLHTEYRSTFQWHTSANENNVGSNPNSTSGISHAVVRQPIHSSKTKAFWSGGQGGEERRGGKRVNITNVNNAGVNEWWLKSSTTDPARPTIHAQTKGHSKRETQLPSEESGGPRKSMSMLSMGTIRALDSTIPQTHYPTTNLPFQNNNAVGGIEPQINMDTARGPDSLEWTENKGYREMSNSYEVPKTSGLDEVKRKEYKSEYKKQFRPFSQYEYVDGKFFKKKGDQETGNPWYKEVIELRKKAGDYRYRGWGTEFVPQHSSDASYHQNVWDQVSKQPSLAALALMTTTKKSISKEDKEKENVRKSMPKRSLSRPNTATPKHPISDFKMKDSEAVQGAKKKYDGPPSTASSRASRGKARSQSAGPAGGRSPGKSLAHHSILSKEREILDKPATRHPRPSSADPSLGFSEPIIKSPPEPTRVKSPEQVILRSPDPVIWTVPLDTTKSFTVTQNIRDAPPSPRFRAGGIDSSSRSGLPPVSGVQSSSSGSTKTSSPSVSSFSPRAGLAQKPKSAGQSQPVTKPSQPIGQQRPSSGIKSPPHTQSVLTGGEKKSIPFNLNGSDTSKPGMIKSAPKLDNRKPEDSTNNNERKPPTTTTSTILQPTRPAPGKLTMDSSLRKPVPGTTLQCLEDPQFMFDTMPKPPYSKSNVPITGTHAASPPTKVTSPPVAAPRGSIRVLEAPLTSPPSITPTGFVPPAPVAVSSSTAKRPVVGSSQVSDSLPQTAASSSSTNPAGKFPSYKVLDAPDPADMYKSISPSTAPTASPATSAGKSKHKFDFKFWGKNKDNEKQSDNEKK